MDFGGKKSARAQNRLRAGNRLAGFCWRRDTLQSEKPILSENGWADTHQAAHPRQLPVCRALTRRLILFLPAIAIRGRAQLLLGSQGSESLRAPLAYVSCIARDPVARVVPESVIRWCTSERRLADCDYSTKDIFTHVDGWTLALVQHAELNARLICANSRRIHCAFRYCTRCFQYPKHNKHIGIAAICCLLNCHADSIYDGPSLASLADSPPIKAHNPPSASTSLTSVPLPIPPKLGLQLSSPSVLFLVVSSSVRAPVRAEAVAASVPACPPPMTMVSYPRDGRAGDGACVAIFLPCGLLLERNGVLHNDPITVFPSILLL